MGLNEQLMREMDREGSEERTTGEQLMRRTSSEAAAGQRQRVGTPPSTTSDLLSTQHLTLRRQSTEEVDL